MRKRLLLLLGTVLLCLGLMPASALAAEPEGYEVSTDWVTGTTTYRFTNLDDVDYFSEEPEGDVVLDFTGADPRIPTKQLNLYVTPEQDDAHVTVRGTAGVNYGYVRLDVRADNADLTLQDFQTESGLSLSSGEGEHEIVYDGDCAIDQLSLGGATSTVRAADDASHLDLGFASQGEKGSVTFSGNLFVERSLTGGTMTIEDALVSFGTREDGSGIVAAQLTIEDSTISGVGHINSVETPAWADEIDALDGSYITITDSQISINAGVSQGNSSSTVLGNSQTITIKGSTVSGIEVTNFNGCLGGIFESIVVEGSTVYAKSDYAAAIGPSDSAYGSSGFSKFGFKDPSITIENSVVEAASTYGAAIGMPRLSGSGLDSERPQLSVTISGMSNVTATSVRSAAIGASSSKEYGDVDGVEIEVGAGDITWGRSSDANPLGKFLSLLGLADDSDLEDDLAKAAELLSGCTVTIKDSPTIRAKSGVMAVYADSVTVTDTNLVQDTMVIADGSENYSIYPMETPGAVKIDSETIGELGYGYASVAKTGVSERSNAAMTFGGAALIDAKKYSQTFSVSANGIHSFFTTPTLALSGSVSITGATDGVATVNTTLKLDLSELVPSRAATVSAGSYENLTFQWYRDGSEITNATFSTYALTNNDNGKVITCVVTGKGFFEGSVTSNAVLVGSQSTVDAPTLAERTENSITLENAGNGYEYRIVGDGNWQGTTEFTSLDSGATYVFQQKDPSGNVSAPASFSTLSKTPAADDFTIDYVNETLSFPSGVYLYSDATCETCLNKNSSKTSIDISGLISSDEVTLYARYATVDLADTDSVTSVTIPARPEAPALADDALTVTSDSIRFAGAEGVAYRLLTSDRVLQTATGNDQKVAFEGLSPATTYTLEMRVEASNDAPATFRSEVVEKNVMTAAAAPAAPVLHALAEVEGDGYESVRVGFSWERPAANGAVISGYAIYAQAEDGRPVQVWSSEGADATSCDVTTSSNSGLQPGGTYAFTLQVSWSAGDGNGTVTSADVQLTLPNLRPDPADFTIGYVDETLTVPSGVSLYKDVACTTPVDLDENNVAVITPYISESNETAQKLYARFTSAGDDTDAVTEIEIPRRPRVNTISDTWLEPGYDSLRIDARGYVEGCSYALMLDKTVIEPSQSNNTRTLYGGLTPDTTYSLVITKPASASSFSSSSTQEIRTKNATKEASDLLVPAASRPSGATISYDLSDLLDDAEIKGVNKVEDNDYILNYASYDTSGEKAVKLQLRSTSVGDSATVEVEAQLPNDGDYLVITLTLRVVDVMAEGDGVYWVRTDLTEDEAAGVESALGALLDGANLLGAFDLKPLNPVGGAAVDDAASTQVTWRPSDGTQAQGTYEVYRISDDAATKLDNVSQADSGITFTAEGTGGCYAVVFRPTTYAVFTAETENGTLSVDKIAAKVGETVYVTVEPASGYEVKSIAASYNGTSLAPTLQTNGKYAFTMPAADVTVSATFALIPPTAPTLSVTSVSADGTADVSWKLAENGAIVTGLSLDVKQNGQLVAGSPIVIPTDKSSYTLTGLAPGEIYELTMTATNDAASATSAVVKISVPKPEDPTYAVSVANDIKNGSLTVSRNEAKAGEEITVTPQPAKGHKVISVTVSKVGGASVEATQDANGTYVFEMPSAGVTVSASFAPITPAVPKLTVVPGDAEGSLVASWTVSSNGAVITGYELAVTLGDEPIEDSPFTPGADDTSYALTGLTPGATYKLILTAYNNDVSSTSEAVEATVPKTQHTVTIAGTEHGSISVSPQNAAEGDTVTITATPDAGYELASVSVTAADDTDVTVENLSFTMPASSVTVSGAFTPIKPEAPALSASYDAEKNAVEVSWTLESNGAVITGYSLAVTSSGNPINGSPFSPNSNATSYELTGLAPGTYELTLTATNNGVSTDSNTVTVTVPEPVAPTYNVNVATVEHGSFLASPTTAKEGDPVIITATPDEGYETASVTVTGTDGDAVSVAPQQDGTYTFTMPASDVTVSGTFRAVAGEDDPDEGDLNALLEKAFKDGDDFDAITLKSGTYELTADLSIAELAEGNENLKTTSLYVGNGTEDATVELDLAGRTLNTDDCALIVLKGSTLTIVDSVGSGSISGRNGLSFTGDDGTKYAYAGGVAVYGTLNLKSGSISGNQASGDGVLGYGGGVYVFGGGVFNMYGGTISGNTASTQGGGVAVRSAADTTPVPEPLYVGDAVIGDWNEVEGDDVVAELSVGLLSADSQTVSGSSDGTFNLYGGTISGNTAPVAGGIYAGGVVTIGADSTTPTAVTVSDNTSGNLYVPADTAVELSATPASGSKVGVTMEKAPGLFASSDSEVASSSRASFTSDNGAYYVVTRQDGLALAYVPAPTYRPEIEVPGGGGTVTTDPRYPEQGDEVTIVPEPDEGKVVGTVEVVDKNGEPVEVIDNGDGTWTYRQPAGTVTITVTFVCDGGELCPSAHLVDVDQSQWYHLAIDWAVTNGVMNGYDDGVTFGPNDSLTRAQMACVLYNLAGKPEVDASSLPADCVLGSWYARAVAWALDEGVFNGYGDGSAFGPDDPLTREQAACMLINAARRLGVDTSARENLSAYPDVDEVSSWARNALSWAVAEGVVNGVEVEGGRELQPGRACTRAEMAALMRNLALCA